MKKALPSSSSFFSSGIDIRIADPDQFCVSVAADLRQEAKRKERRAGAIEGHGWKKTYTRERVIERGSAIYIAIVVVIIVRRCTLKSRESKALYTIGKRYPSPLIL